MTVRDQLVDVLSGLVPLGIHVKAYAEDIPRPSKPTVMVRVDEVAPNSVARHTHRDYNVSLVLLATSEDTSGPADDELDALLEDTLYVLDQGAGAELLPTWSSAKRAVYQDTVAAYEVSCQLICKKQPLSDPITPTP